MTDVFSNRASILLGATVIVLLWAALAPPSLAQRAETTENKPVQLTRLRVNGVDLHYLEIGKGVPVIFVHGGLDDYRMWDAQLEPFSQQYRVIAYSRRYNYPNKPTHPPRPLIHRGGG